MGPRPCPSTRPECHIQSGNESGHDQHNNLHAGSDNERTAVTGTVTMSQPARQRRSLQPLTWRPPRIHGHNHHRGNGSGRRPLAATTCGLSPPRSPDSRSADGDFDNPRQLRNERAINQTVSATFSTAMNPATINGTTFTLQLPGGASVAGLVAYSAISNSLTFTPAANLAANTTFTATSPPGPRT